MTELDGEDILSVLHNAWIHRQIRCQELGHRDKWSRAFTYGPGHVVVVILCDICYKAGKKQHREMARKLAQSKGEVEKG